MVNPCKSLNPTTSPTSTMVTDTMMMCKIFTKTSVVRRGHNKLMSNQKEEDSPLRDKINQPHSSQLPMNKALTKGHISLYRILPRDIKPNPKKKTWQSSNK